jgi:signal peptidase I
MDHGMSKVEASSGPRKSATREYLESIVVAVILALFIRTFIVQAFKIPTGSMEKNLLVGDHLLVNKLMYSPSSAAWEQKVLAKRTVKRGDVVVFKYPEDPGRDFIKRVIGLPGETVAVRGKGVYIDGKLLHEDYTFYMDQRGYGEPTHATEKLPERWEDVKDSEDRVYGPEQVPEGQVFVLGDNRDNSRDSRFWGFLPLDQIKGRALLVYWSYEASKEEYNRTGARWLWDTLTALARTRTDRFFHLIR